MNDFLLNLVLKKRLGATWKWSGWLSQSYCVAMRKSKQLQNNFIHTHILSNSSYCLNYVSHHDLVQDLKRSRAIIYNF